MTNLELRHWVLDPARTEAELHAAAATYPAVVHVGLPRHQVVINLVDYLATLPPGDPSTYTPPAVVAPPMSLIHKLVTAFMGLQLVADILWLVVIWPFLGIPGKREIVIFLIGFSLLASIAGIVYALSRQPGVRHTRRGIHGMILGGITGVTLELLAILVVIFGLLVGWPLVILLVVLGIMSLSADATATTKHINYTP